MYNSNAEGTKIVVRNQINIINNAPQAHSQTLDGISQKDKKESVSSSGEKERSQLLHGSNSGYIQSKSYGQT